MLSTLVLAAALNLLPAQMPALRLSNDRLPFGGEFGPPRADNKFLPGDRVFLAFDIEGLKLDDFNRATFSMGLAVTDVNGKLVYEQKPARQETQIPLGGNKLPARAYFDTSLDMSSGTYTCQVTVKDLTTNESKSIDKKFDVLPKTFGLVNMYVSGDDKGEVPAPLQGMAGQALWLNFVIVGFERAGQAKQPDLEITFRTLDSDKKPTAVKPRVETLNAGVPETESRLPISLPLPLNRVGTFTVEITVKDKVAGKTADMTFQVTVSPAGK
jgi:hypothetical protein